MKMPSGSGAPADRPRAGRGRRSRGLSAYRDPRRPDPQHRGRRRARGQVPGLELIIFESGGDNLASTFSLDLVDWWIFVIDVAGGDDIPRKRGPGVIRSDLLVVNKVDLAPHVGVDLPRMLAEASAVRNGGPVVATDLRHGEAVEAVADAICAAVLFKA